MKNKKIRKIYKMRHFTASSKKYPKSPYVAKNLPSIVFFIHGYGSSSSTDKFTCIEFENKEAIDIDYDKGVKNAYEKVKRRLETLMLTHEVFLVGHSMGGYLANKFSSELRLPALLIAPVLYHVIPFKAKKDIFDMPFKLDISGRKVWVMLENDDENLDINKSKEAIKKFPRNYKRMYFDGGSHRICRDDRINYIIDDYHGTLEIFG